MSAARPFEGIRRVLARLGSRATVRSLSEPLEGRVRVPAPVGCVVRRAPALDATGVEAHAVSSPRAVVRHSGPGGGGLRVRGGATTAMAAAVRAVRPGAERPRVTDVAALPRRVRPRAADAVFVGSSPVRRARAVAPPAVRRPHGAAAARLALMRRAPLSWEALDRARLAAAWTAVTEGHGMPGGDLELVGVYGPLPVDAVRAVGVSAGRAADVHLEARDASAAIGDLALARHRDDGRLLSAVIRRDPPAAGPGRSVG